MINVLGDNEQDATRIVRAINQLTQGRSNAVGQCTLTENDTTTVVTAINCGESSSVLMFPATANAAAIVADTYVSSVDNGSFTVTHANDANTDKTFLYVCLG